MRFAQDNKRASTGHQLPVVFSPEDATSSLGVQVHEEVWTDSGNVPMQQRVGISEILAEYAGRRLLNSATRCLTLRRKLEILRMLYRTSQNDPFLVVARTAGQAFKYTVML